MSLLDTIDSTIGRLEGENRAHQAAITELEATKAKKLEADIAEVLGDDIDLGLDE